MPDASVRSPTGDLSSFPAPPPAPRKAFYVGANRPLQNGARIRIVSGPHANSQLASMAVLVRPNPQGDGWLATKSWPGGAVFQVAGEDIRRDHPNWDLVNMAFPSTEFKRGALVTVTGGDAVNLETGVLLQKQGLRAWLVIPTGTKLVQSFEPVPVETCWLTLA